MTLLFGALPATLSATLSHGQVIRLDRFTVAEGLHPYTLPSPEELQGVSVSLALREIVSRLDDDSFAIRDQATKELTDLHPNRLEVYALLAANDLTTEQRYRLLTVLRDILLNTPRGALGIRMQPFANNAGGPIEIRIDELIRGLPAERVLQIGDRIIQVDGQPMATYDDLHFRVQTKKPGEKVHLRVKRQKLDDQGNALRDAENNPLLEELDLEFELGSAELLDKAETGAPPGQPVQFRQQSRVELARRIEAEDAAETFAPEGKSIGVEGGVAALFQGSQTRGDGAGDRDLDPDIERHPSIRSINQQRKYLNEARMVETDALRESWNMELANLFTRVRDPRLNVAQRDELLRVIERFAELMGE